MRDIVERYIVSNDLFDINKPIGVALSGGRDSVALLYVMREINCECVALHCNFRLRGKESDRDETFVKQLCQKLNVNLVVRHFNTEVYAQEKGISIEMAARELRYQWFEQQRSKLKLQAIAVAHHKDDQAETVLLNLIRGTGLKGLGAMKNRNGNIVRPLLCVGRKDIENYLKENNINYVDDSTNQQTIYKRNKIRLDIMPLLAQLNHNIIDNLCHEADIFSRTYRMLSQYIENDKQDISTETEQELTININQLKAKPHSKELLYYILVDYNFKAEQIGNIYESLDNQSGKRFYAGDYCLIKDRDDLIVYKTKNYLQEPKIRVLKRKRKEQEIFPSANSNVAIVDASVLDQPLSLRHWQEGDVFYPIGMKQKKKLSDFFTDQKLSLKQKHEVWLLLSGDEIVWIVGQRLDNRFKVTENTTKVAEITISTK
ncbi:MAG: tRNA lysidine(34) synthetase TilS [Paludibacteraceae bacterium]|nr:tRNA lysidine(34) synthetase TilS [Paludibacteraceae bacterium]